jgi:uncharacterized protein
VDVCSDSEVYVRVTPGALIGAMPLIGPATRWVVAEELSRVAWSPPGRFRKRFPGQLPDAPRLSFAERHDGGVSGEHAVPGTPAADNGLFLVYNGGIVQEVIDQKEAIAALCRELRVERLYLFGSGASEASMADVHDLDFLVRFKPVDPGQYAHRYFYLAERLEELFKAKVDLVELDAIDNPYFKEAVDKTTVPVYESA